MAVEKSSGSMQTKKSLNQISKKIAGEVASNAEAFRTALREQNPLTASAEAYQPSVPKRNMKGTKQVFHDLFKLLPTAFKKIIGVPDPAMMKANPDLARMVDVEHCHFFHSVDSNGVPQKYSNSIGGHCHKVEIVLDAAGNFQAECGPPLRRHSKSRVEMKEAYDRHTHKIEYVESEEFTARKANQGAVMYAASMATPSMPSGAQ